MGIFGKDFGRGLTAFVTGGLSEVPRLLKTPTAGVPGRSPQEQELLDLQIDQLRRAGATQEELEPFLLRELGFERTPEGELRRIEGPDDELQQLLEQRAVRALRGEVDPVVEAGIEADRARTETFLSRRLGPGFRLSTPGLETEARFGRQAALTREQARSGAIGQATQLAGQRRGLLSDVQQRRLGALQGVSAPRLGLIGAAGQVQQPFQFERGLQFQAGQQRAAQQAQLGSDIFGLLGLGVGASLGGPAGAGVGQQVGSVFGGLSGGEESSVRL